MKSAAVGGVDPGAVDVAAAVLGPLAHVGGPLGARTTCRAGGPAAVLVVAATLHHLGAVAVAHRRSGLPVLVVGRGSNLLVADAGYPGIAVVLDPADTAFGWVDLRADGFSAGAAAPLPTLARRSVESGLAGFEWAVGVPGSLGGAIRMNAGGHGSDMASSIVTATVADLAAEVDDAGDPRLSTWTPTELRHRYRHSAVGPLHVVVSADVVLRTGDVEEGRATIREIVRWRRDHQPGGNNAGSVFTNPAGEPAGRSAGWFVEAAGARGMRSGSAEVSTKHANFIQVDPGGSADDVYALIEEVRNRVLERFGVGLTTEIQRVGFVDTRPLLEG